MTKKVEIIILLIFVLIVCFGIKAISLAQVGNSNTLPTPEIKLTYASGEAGQTPEDGSTGATIIATIPEEQQCECGALFEAKLQNSDEWVVLGLYSPDDVGDEYTQYAWALASNAFQPNVTYDIRVFIYDRIGNKSDYGTNQLVMTPYHENPCSDGTFANIKKSVTGEGENAKIILSWDKVCKEQREATVYTVYKNGQVLDEIEEISNYYVAAGSPDGATWKIEAYGEEPSNNNAAVITSCEELVAKMRSKAVSVKVKEIYNGKCLRVGTWLRAIVEFDTYPDGYQPNCGNPGGWLNCAIAGINAGSIPYFNFVPGHFTVTGQTGLEYWNAFVSCGQEGQQVPNASGSVTDPWNQVDWTCTNVRTEEGNNFYNTDRFWVNFDLNNAGSSSIWPVTVEFTY